MKVLHVLNELMASGAEVMMRCSAPYWQKSGIECEILSTGDEVGPYVQDLQYVGYPIHHIPFKKSVLFFIEFYNLIRAKKYDIVHIHCERGFFYYGLIARLAGMFIVRTVHSTFLFNNYLAFRRRVHLKLFHWLGGEVISISPSVKENELKRFRNRTILIMNWYDDLQFKLPSDTERKAARELFCIPENTVVVASVGNCAPVKNHGELFKALTQIQASVPFIYIHAGKEEKGEPERKLAEELGVLRQTRFLGYTRDVIPVLHAADIFIMPSLREGFGIAAIEALGTGIFSILADVAGLRDLKGIPGVIWTTPDSMSIAEGIKQFLIMDEVERETIRLQAISEIKCKYNVERGVRAYVDIYKNLIEKSKTPGAINL